MGYLSLPRFGHELDTELNFFDCSQRLNISVPQLWQWVQLPLKFHGNINDEEIRALHQKFGPLCFVQCEPYKAIITRVVTVRLW